MEVYGRVAERLLPENRGFISVTGGGGKTTFLSGMGRYLASRGLRVIITTTTKVASPYLHDYGADRTEEDERVLSSPPSQGELVFYAEHHTLDMKKWVAPREEVLSALYRLSDVVIAEADGSRGLPLKIHTERDPVINPSATATVAVMGLWGIGEKACFASFGEERDVVIDREYLDWYVNAEEGLLKGMTGKCAIIFNGAENCGEDVFSMLRSVDYPQNVSVYAASLREDRIYEVIRESC